MLRINLQDSNFAHHAKDQSLSEFNYPSFFRWERANVLVSDTVFITDSHIQYVDKYKAKRKVGLLIEPPEISPDIYKFADQNYKKFDYILTFDKSLLDTGRNFLFYPFGCCWVQDVTTPTKNKICSMVASNKRMTQGHNFRQQVIEQFSNRVDHYGNGFKRVNRKEDALRDYYFSIVLENSRPQYYFSEKIIDCMASRTVPIYWGSDVSPFFDMNGILTFNTIEELENIFKTLTPDLYHSMSSAIENNFNKVNTYRVPEDWIYKHYPFLFDSYTFINETSAI